MRWERAILFPSLVIQPKLPDSFLAPFRHSLANNFELGTAFSELCWMTFACLESRTVWDETVGFACCQRRRLYDLLSMTTGYATRRTG